MARPRPDRLPHEKGFHVSWDQLHRDARALAWRLDGEGPGEGGTWRAVVAITRGGMVPAMIVAREIDIRAIDTISVRSYLKGSQGELAVLKSPDAGLMGDGEGILVVDDLADNRAFLESVLTAEGARAAAAADGEGGVRRALAEAFDADIAVVLELNAFQIQSPSSPDMFEGHSAVHIRVVERNHPKDDRGREQTERPKVAKVISDADRETTFPIRGPMPASSEVTATGFKNRFLKLVATEVSWHFVDHAPGDNIQDARFDAQ